MKVSSAGKRKADSAAPYSGGSKGNAVAKAAAPGGVFADIAEDLEVRALLDELDAIGGMLSRFSGGALLGRYKELVRMALERAKNNTRLRREYKWRRTERAMYVIIERAEGALGEMDEALLREGERTRLLSLIDEIKGCLISLLL